MPLRRNGEIIHISLFQLSAWSRYCGPEAVESDDKTSNFDFFFAKWLMLKLLLTTPNTKVFPIHCEMDWFKIFVRLDAPVTPTAGCLPKITTTHLWKALVQIRLAAVLRCTGDSDEGSSCRIFAVPVFVKRIGSKFFGLLIISFCLWDIFIIEKNLNAPVLQQKTYSLLWSVIVKSTNGEIGGFAWLPPGSYLRQKRTPSPWLPSTGN